MRNLSAEEQLKLIKSGCVDLISEVDLLQKLKKSVATGQPLRIKLGADPSRPDLHIGHMVVIQKLKLLQDLGHQVLFLIGDFTAMIGDPTGRNETRKPLTLEEVAANAATYSEQIFKVLDPERTEVVYNGTWLNKLSPQELIKLTSQYTLARLLERDDFSKRFKSGVAIHLHEFLYPLLQGYDSVALQADLELGGTDQTFNLLVGRELQKSYGQAPQCVLTMPLLEGLDGVQKMSKSYGNTIGLTDSPTDMFGKIMSISDELMYRYYLLLTDKTSEQIQQMREGVVTGSLHPRNVKVQLAQALIEKYHGSEAAVKAVVEFDRVFRDKGLPDVMAEHLVVSNVPQWICQVIKDIQFAPSTSEARRLIEGGGVSLDDLKIEDPKFQLEMSPGQKRILKVGKKKFIRLVGSETK